MAKAAVAPAKPAARKLQRSATQQAASNPNAIAKSKANAQQTAQPGVIATIMALLTEAKKKRTTYTVTEMVERLAKAFPQRKQSGMAITVRAQVARLPNEKDFPVKKVRDGRICRYAAE